MPYGRQIAYLQQIGVTEQGVDELALEFDDNFKALPGLLERGELTNELAECLQTINSMLDDLSSSDDCWNPEALRNDPRWQEIRIVAADCLAPEVVKSDSMFRSSSSSP
jgi:hypothetical protein